MASMIEYQRHGTPLEDYLLTKRDHRDQRTAKDIRQHVEKQAAAWSDEEAADPELRRARAKNVERAWGMITASPTPDYQIMRWRVRLYCGHIVETRRHCEVDQPRAHGSSSMKCPECSLDPARIVAYEPIGMLGEPPRPQAPSTPVRPTRKQLEARVAQLEAELAELKQRP